MIKWIKPSGAEVETNDLEANIDMALSLGWKTEEMLEKEKAEKPEEKAEEKKRGRPSKNKD